MCMILYNILSKYWEGHMNISLESFPKKKQDALDALTHLLSNNKKEKVKADEKGSESRPQTKVDDQKSFLDVASLNQRDLLKTQLTVDGLEKIAFLLEEKRPVEQKVKVLEDIISSTRFQEQRILAEYKDTLYKIVESADKANLNILITEQKQKLLGLTLTENTAQNILSANSLKENKEYDLLLKNIVNQIKSQGGSLEFNIKPEKVLDLLS
jgi:hypothetical protein